MAERKFIVLRSKRPVVPEGGFVLGAPGPAAVRGAETMELEEAALTKAERADLRRDPRRRSPPRPRGRGPRPGHRRANANEAYRTDGY